MEIWNLNTAIINFLIKTIVKIKKISFKRKKGGGDGEWGVGLDYLLKDYWDDLDKLVEDNYYGRHNAKLINFLFPKVLLALENSVSEMKCFCGSGKKMADWIKKAKKIQNFGKTSKTLGEKVVFIDTTVQFLRETSVKDKIIRRVLKKKIDYKQKQFKGMVAWGGFKKIRGIVRVVLDEKDFSKFKRGEILVTDETDASFLPLMQKAKAIITDEGGILCHAAIVSREIKKPCVVGTKIANRVLKAGDKVEIDISGAVRVL